MAEFRNYTRSFMCANVKVEFLGSHIDYNSNEEDRLEVTSSFYGKYKFDENKKTHTIKYEERLLDEEGSPIFDVTLRISEGHISGFPKVTLSKIEKTSGHLATRMIFSYHEITYNKYFTAIGIMPMEILTSNIDLKKLESSLSLSLSYSFKLGGSDMIASSLNILISIN